MTKKFKLQDLYIDTKNTKQMPITDVTDLLLENFKKNVRELDDKGHKSRIYVRAECFNSSQIRSIKRRGICVDYSNFYKDEDVFFISDKSKNIKRIQFRFKSQKIHGNKGGL